MDDSKAASSSSQSAQGRSQTEEEGPQKPAKFAHTPVQGVPVGYGGYPQQPQQYYGHGAYSSQGQAAPPYPPYNPHEPTSFEIHEVTPGQPLPCLCGIQLVLFLCGWFFPICWFCGALLPLCMRQIDPREKLGWLINSVASVVFVILVIIVFAKYHHTWYQSTPYVNGPY